MTRSTTRPARRRPALVASALALGVTLLAGCGSDEPTDPAAEPTPDVPSSQSTGPAKKEKPTEQVAPAGATLAVQVNGSEITPSGKAITMSVGDTLTVQVTSDRSGELHVHSSPEQYVNFKAGETRRDITIDKPGQVDIEEHDSGALIARLLVS
jgi:hypothetical protein